MIAMLMVMFCFQLFIAQYHIWLAADTRGILVLIPANPLMNLIATSFIFICASHELNYITARLVLYLVPQQPQKLTRNIVCAGLTLTFLAWHR